MKAYCFTNELRGPIENRCTGVNSCPFAGVFGGLCRQHFLDLLYCASLTRFYTGHSWNRSTSKAIFYGDIEQCFRQQKYYDKSGSLSLRSGFREYAMPQGFKTQEERNEERAGTEFLNKISRVAREAKNATYRAEVEKRKSEREPPIWSSIIEHCVSLPDGHYAEFASEGDVPKYANKLRCILNMNRSAVLFKFQVKPMEYSVSVKKVGRYVENLQELGL